MTHRAPRSMAAGRSGSQATEDIGADYPARPAQQNTTVPTTTPTVEDDMHRRPTTHRPIRWADVTRRGWATLTAGLMCLGLAGGMAVSSGDDPCTWAVNSSAACDR